MLRTSCVPLYPPRLFSPGRCGPCWALTTGEAYDGRGFCPIVLARVQVCTWLVGPVTGWCPMCRGPRWFVLRYADLGGWRLVAGRVVYSHPKAVFYYCKRCRRES